MIRYGVLTSLLAPLATIGLGSDGSAERKAPSIIIVLIDTLRADYLGSYGFEGGISPYLDRMATESVLFERCYAQAPSTLPSVASLFTSLHPTAHGVVGKNPRRIERPTDDSRPSANTIPPDAITLAEALSATGYATAAFVTNPWLAREFRFDRGFRLYEHRFRGSGIPAHLALKGAFRWLSTASKDPRPFFIYVHLMDVHGPYDAPSSDVEAVRESSSLGVDRELTDTEIGGIANYFRTSEWVNGDDGKRLRGWRTRYAGGVHAVDRRLEPFFEGLRSKGILDDAVVVLTSDHGEELCEHHGWNHGRNLYDHQLHVPLIIRYPWDGLRGVRVPDVVSLGDLMVTLLNIAGAAIPESAAGTDLTPSPHNRTRADSEHVTMAAGIGRRPSLHSIQTRNHKLIFDIASGDAELYDLDADPGEQTDLSETEVDTVQRLVLRLQGELQRVGAAPARTRSAVEMSPEMEERLRALGYLE